MVHRNPEALTVDAATLASLQRSGSLLMLVDKATIERLTARRSVRARRDPDSRFVTNIVRDGGEARMQPNDWLC